MKKELWKRKVEEVFSQQPEEVWKKIWTSEGAISRRRDLLAEATLTFTYDIVASGKEKKGAGF